MTDDNRQAERMTDLTMAFHTTEAGFASRSRWMIGAGLGMLR